MNNQSQETKQLPKNHHQDQMNAIVKAMIVSFSWSFADFLEENRHKND